MTFHPGRESRWQYADQTVEAIERWNCSRGHGCTHGAEKGSSEWHEFGPGARGAYAGTECCCPHHTAPPLPVDAPEPAAEVELLLARHCPSCTCPTHPDRKAH